MCIIWAVSFVLDISSRNMWQFSWSVIQWIKIEHAPSSDIIYVYAIESSLGYMWLGSVFCGETRVKRQAKNEMVRDDLWLSGKDIFGENRTMMSQMTLRFGKISGMLTFRLEAIGSSWATRYLFYLMTLQDFSNRHLESWVDFILSRYIRIGLVSKRIWRCLESSSCKAF